jgi:hypothetical protein
MLFSYIESFVMQRQEKTHTNKYINILAKHSLKKYIEVFFFSSYKDQYIN